MVDKYDNGRNKDAENPIIPLNIKKKEPGQDTRRAAVAIADSRGKSSLPQITAAGRGKIAEQILQLAFANGIKVREDSALAEMLTALGVDSPVPNEALVAVAEILSYVYRANGAPNPYDAVFADESENKD